MFRYMYAGSNIVISWFSFFEQFSFFYKNSRDISLFYLGDTYLVMGTYM